MPNLNQLRKELKKESSTKHKKALALLADGSAVITLLSDPSGILTIASLIKLAKSGSDAFSNLKTFFGNGNQSLKELFDRADSLSYEIHLICQYSYFDSMAQTLALLPNKIKEKQLSPTTFKPLPNLQFEKFDLSLETARTNLLGCDELFTRYNKRLEAILTFICPENINISEQISQIGEKARERAKTAISIHPELSRLQSNLLLSKIDQQTSGIASNPTDSYRKHRELEPADVTITSNAPTTGIRESYGEDDRQKLDKILKLLDEKPDLTSKVDPSLITQFEKAKSHLNEGTFEKAEHQFETLIGILEELGSDEETIQLRGRCESNLGIALYQQRKRDESLKHFDNAFNLNPKNITIATLKAQCCHWQGETDQALSLLERLHIENPENTMVLVTLADIEADKFGPLAALKRLEEQENYTDEAYSLTKAQHLVKSGRIDDAIEDLRQALNKNKDSFQIKMSLAAALLRQSGSDLRLATHPDSKIKKEHLQEARSLLESVEEEIKNKGTSNYLHSLRFDLGLVYLLSNQPTQAVEQFEGIKKDQVDCAEISQNLILAYLLSEQREDALILARKSAEKYPSLESYRSFCGCLNANRKFKNTLDFMAKDGLFAADFAGDSILQIQKFEALQGLHMKTEADKIAKALEANFPKDSRVLACLGEYYFTRRNIEEGERLFNDAILFSREGLANLLANQFGLLLWRAGETEKALPMLRRGFLADEENPLSYEISDCLLTKGELSQARDLISTQDIEGADTRTLDLRSAIAIKMSDFRDAYQVLEHLIQKSERPEYRFRLVYVSQVLGKDERASDILDDTYEKFSADVRVIVRLSATHYERGEFKKGFLYAKEAYQIDNENKDAIISICRALTVPEGSLDLTGEEQKLLQDCIEKNKGLEKITCTRNSDGKTNLSPILDRVRSRSEYSQETIDSYQASRGSLFNLLPLCGGNLWECYRSAINSSNVNIFSATGTASEQQEQIEVALNANEIVLDFTTILVLFEVGLTEIILQKFDTVYVPGAILIAFKQALSEVVAFAGGRGVLSFDGGQFQMANYPEGFHEQSRESLQRIVDFLQSSNVVLRGVQPEKIEGLDENSDLNNLPDLIFSPFALAAELSAPCWSDQGQLMSAMSRNSKPVKSFNTHSLIMALEKDGVIGTNFAEDTIIALISLGYRSISNRSTTIVRCVEKGDNNSTEIGRRLIKRINNSDWEPNSSAAVLGEATARIWLHNSLPREVKFRWIGIVAKEIEKGLFNPDIIYPFLHGTFILLKFRPSLFFGLYDQIGLGFSKAAEIERGFLRRVKIAMADAFAQKARQGFWFFDDVTAKWVSQARLETILLREEYRRKPIPKILPQSRDEFVSKKERKRRRRELKRKRKKS